MTNQPLDFVPMWAMYFLTVLAMLATMEAGYRLNRAMRRKSPDKTDVGLGGMVGASLGLLAFLLAFVVGFGANINTERRHLVVDEANAIGTTYLRAGYLAEPYRAEARDLLREYTDLRLAGLDPTQLAAAVARSERIHNELWASAEKIAIESPSPTTGLYLSSLNEVIDRHAERVAVGVDIRIPPSVLLGLYVVALFATFLVGLRSGDGEKRNYLAHLVLVLILSVVFLLIVDLDRAQEGLLQVSQLPMIDLQRQLNASP
jgi:Na+/proline symporter